MAPVDARELADRQSKPRYEKKAEGGAEAPAEGEEKKEAPEKPAEPEVVYDSLSGYYESVGVKKTQPVAQAGGIARDEKKLEKFTNKNEKVFIKKDLEAPGRSQKRSQKTGAYIAEASELDELVQSRKLWNIWSDSLCTYFE